MNPPGSPPDGPTPGMPPGWDAASGPQGQPGHQTSPPPPGYQQGPPPPGYQPGFQPGPQQGPPHAPGHQGPPFGGPPFGGPPFGGPPFGGPPFGGPPFGGPPPGGGWRPVHRPGALPLRPLRLGDMYDSAIKIVRHNAAATMGAALIIGILSVALPLLLVTQVSDPIIDGSDIDDADTASIVTQLVALAVAALFSAFGAVVVTGMIAMVCRAAAIGRTLTLSEAWQATAGSRLRLIGLTCVWMLAMTAWIAVLVGGFWVAADTDTPALAVLWGILVLPLALVGLVWAWTRIYLLAPSALVVERLGVAAAMGRAHRLSAGDFWRLLGIGLLTVLLTGIVSNIISVPFTAIAAAVAAGGDERTADLAVVIATAVSAVIANALTMPFVAAVTNLQYLDQRIRKEAYDVQLASEAGVLGA